jgi:hypothetical protein
MSGNPQGSRCRDLAAPYILRSRGDVHGNADVVLIVRWRVAGTNPDDLPDDLEAHRAIDGNGLRSCFRRCLGAGAIQRKLKDLDAVVALVGDENLSRVIDGQGDRTGELPRI